MEYVYQFTVCNDSQVVCRSVLIDPTQKHWMIVVCKRRKKRITRRPNSWRTFWSFRQFASHYRQLKLTCRQRDPNCRRFWPCAPIIGRKVGCYALLRLLHTTTRVTVSPLFANASWQWLVVAGDCLWLQTMAGSPLY